MSTANDTMVPLGRKLEAYVTGLSWGKRYNLRVLAYSQGGDGKMSSPTWVFRMGPQVPLYEPLNVQIKSYDFTVLETFSSYIHKTAENMGIEVDDCWATPCKKFKIQTFKPNSTQVDNQYYLNQYERNVQIVDLPTTTAPIFFTIIQAALPEGVEMKVKPHEDVDEELRYVPDLELKQLKSELDALGGPTISKSKR
uniref:EOG090X0MUO n=1 Tax=Ceriodaphnia reticulata TaxID=302197 RepID=A0A4Y7M0R0_9CRUS|nr:EOG090X0MUO [Ceriodaphnia reticulata]SVE73355.1 EOG090X0MUO [Ceriodaphnia reticulata]